MEYMGHTQTASYSIGPRSNASSGFLPSIGSRTKTLPEFDTASRSVRRSLNNLSWRPSTYYKTTRAESSDRNFMHSTVEPNSARSALTELEGLRVPQVFSAARNALYTRYTPQDWFKSAEANFNTSDKIRSVAEKIRYDTLRLARESDDKTRRTQEDSDKKLGERVCDISFLKTELNNEIDNIISESNMLGESKRLAEKVFGETENPLHVTQECLYNREKRSGIDLVHDDPERSLLEEVDEIKKCQNKLAAVIDKATAQLNLNRAAQHELERDSHDKFSAQKLDERAHGLKNSSSGIAYYDGVENVDNCISTPETWAKFTSNNLQRSQAEREASRRIRQEIEACLNDCQDSMRKRWQDVNEALTKRIQETTDSRNKVQSHLGRVLQEIFDMEKNIAYLKKCLLDKEAPMKVAQTRLHIRLGKPNMEACRDAPRSQIIEEVHEIRESVDSLRRQLREAESSLQHLLSIKAQLENDLNVKTNSLHIDREKCLGLRKSFPMTTQIP